MKVQVHNTVNRFRLAVVLLVIVLVTTIMMWRAFDLHVMNKDFLQTQGNARYMRTLPVAAHRGMITDRNGDPLAVSTPVDSVWVQPKEFLSAQTSWPQVAKLLDLEMEQLQTQVLQRSNREFVYIKRHVAPDLAQKVAALDIPGVYLQREYRRYYPTGEVAAHVLGFSNIDDIGQEGLELAYDDWLRGHAGSQLVIKDRLGHVIKHVESLREAQPGKDLALSLDRRLQYLAYRELKSAVFKHKAKSGSAVILDVQTGEVLAMVNQPSYNPNNRSQLNNSFLRNRAVTDVFEPGSTIKPFTILAALQSGKFTAKTMIDTSPGIYHIGSYTVRDARNYGRINLPTIITKSSNVGATKLALAISAERLWKVHQSIGLGEVSASGFPGEVSGILNFPNENRQVEKASLAYGYGLSVTALQLARAYAVLANQGKLLPVSFVKVQQAVQGKQIFSARYAKQILAMLETVVSAEGTGELAKVKGYRIAGKTGTVKKASAGGYSDDRYISVFAGIAPASQPRLAMVVTVNEPRGDVYYGGQVAAPVFSRVMSGALRLLDIAPDQVNENNVILAGLPHHALGGKP